MTFSKELLNWYHENKRHLPWRKTVDPYKIWLSEIILQQTRVEQGLPYYQAFCEEYPTIFDLAQASENQVLKTWQGLGYYSRARNLHATAQTIANLYDGNFPDSYDELLKLKGIGPYTAAAIASFAFRQKVALVDGNVYRVLTRVFGIEDAIDSNSGKKKVNTLAQELLPMVQAHDYNQAIMEFGALQCVPKNPNCGFCIFAQSCWAYKNQKVALLPLKLKKIIKTERFINYAVIKIDNKTWIKQRINDDIWRGLYDFPEIENLPQTYSEAELWQAFERLKLALKIKGPFSLINISPIYKHLLTHQTIYARFFEIEANNEGNNGNNNLILINLHFDQTVALPKLLVNYLKKSNFLKA